MQARYGWSVLCASAAFSAVLNAQPAPADGGQDTARVIVKLRPHSSVLAGRLSGVHEERDRRARVLGQRLGMAMRSGPALSEEAQVVIVPGARSEAVARRLAQESDVEYAVPDRRRRAFVAPNDPLYANGVGGNGPAAGQWYLRAPTSTLVSSINAEAAWALTTGSPSVVVAVLDTGVRYDHPDLLSVAAGGNLLPGYDMIGPDPDGTYTTANDGDGRDADASDPGDWVSSSDLANRASVLYQCQTTASQSSWHGTQMAGLIAARTNDGIGMASVGRNVRVLPVRVIGKCGGYDSDIIAGMRWAGGLSVPGVPANPYPARVINMSLGGEGICNSPYPETIAALNALGVSVVVAAGNSTGHAVEAPANCPGAIAVGGLRHAGTKAGYADLGPEVAISAPAGNCVNSSGPCLYPILSTWNTGTTVPGTSTYTDSYNYFYGTSLSAPLVSGTVALMLSVQPSLTPAQVRQVLQATARPFPATGGSDSTVQQCTAPQYDATGNALDQLECYCTTSTCGAGMLDTGAAVAAVGGSAPSPTPDIAQHGLTGIWYNRAWSGQGFGLEIFPDSSRAQLSWFTFDTGGAGGADRQRWYTAGGAVVAGSSSATLAIYQNAGGNFNAPPATQAQQVGTGALAFTDCATAQFTFAFSDGSGRSGTIPLTRITPNVTCTTTGARPTNSDFAFSGNWYAPSTSGQGFFFEYNPAAPVFYFAWYTYAPNGQAAGAAGQRWYTGQTNSTVRNARSFTMPIYETTGGIFDTPTPPGQATAMVGTATVTFASCAAATLTYQFSGGTSAGQAGTINLARTSGTIPPGCVY